MRYASDAVNEWRQKIDFRREILYGRGEACKPGETAEKSGCVPAKGDGDGAELPGTEQIQSLDADQARELWLELGKIDVDPDSPKGQRVAEVRQEVGDWMRAVRAGKARPKKAKRPKVQKRPGKKTPAKKQPRERPERAPAKPEAIPVANVQSAVRDLFAEQDKKEGWAAQVIETADVWEALGRPDVDTFQRTLQEMDKKGEIALARPGTTEGLDPEKMAVSPQTDLGPQFFVRRPPGLPSAA
jgi:hypothetical protein